MEEATIVGINIQKGRAVASTRNGEYILIELMTGDEIEMHDIISCSFDTHPLGGEVILNKTSGRQEEVYIQDYCSKENAQVYLTDP